MNTPDGQPLDAFENSVLLSILGECALALENIKNAREKEEAAVMVKNEQLRANLFRSTSHDLRTPLASISGNASNPLANHQYNPNLPLWSRPPRPLDDQMKRLY